MTIGPIPYIDTQGAGKERIEGHLMKDNRQSHTGITSLSGFQSPAQPLSAQPLAASESAGIILQEELEIAPVKCQEAKLKFAEETHQYVREYIRLADQKATFFFAGSTALLTYLHKQGLASKWISALDTWRLSHMLSFIAAMGLLLSAVACMLVVMPRLTGSRRGLVFFGAIAEFENSNDYVSEFMKQSLYDLCDAKIRHTYDLSSICKTKYRMLKWGQWLGGGGLISALLLLVLV